MSDSPSQIKAAKQFAVALVSNIKLLNAFLAAERKIIQINPEFETASLDNFLVDHHYDCTLDQVVQYGKPILSDLKHWAGTYYTQTSPEGAKSWVDGPQVVIGSDGSVSFAGATIADSKFSFLNLTWSGNSLMFYMAKDPDGGSTRIPAMFGTSSGNRLIGLSKQPQKKQSSSQDESTFMRVVGVIGKYLGQINQAFQMYDLIKKATGLQEKVDAGDVSAEGELGDVRIQLSEEIAGVSESQGEIATTQQQAMQQEMMDNPNITMEEASNAIRDAQSDELELEQVDDVDAAQLDPAGEAIGEVSVEDGGIEISAALGEEAVGEVTVDMFLEDALVIVLL